MGVVVYTVLLTCYSITTWRLDVNQMDRDSGGRYRKSYELPILPY